MSQLANAQPTPNVVSFPDVGSRPKLLDRVRHAIRTRHYSSRTEEAYVHWIRRYIVFHEKKHPSTLGAPDISRFLTWLAVERQVSASTQNQALSAVLFLYKDVLAIEVGAVPPVVRARTPERLPVVLSRDEIGAILKQLTGTPRLIVMVLYGSGVRLEECLGLRVKDLDFDRHQIIVRQGKGHKDRVTMLPAAVRETLTVHLADVRRLHEADLARGFGRAVLPFALDRKFPNAPTEWRWQFVFPAGRICRDPRYGSPSRYHLHKSVVQKAVANAARLAGTTKRLSPHVMRHYSHASPRRWVRHSHSTGATRPSGRPDDDDLFARDEPRRARREESDGPAVSGYVRVSRHNHGSPDRPISMEVHGGEALGVGRLHRCCVVTRQCRRVTKQISRLAEGWATTLAR